MIVVEPTPNSTCFNAHAEAPLPRPHPRGVHGRTSESFFEHPIWVFCKTIPAPRLSMTNVVRGLPIHTMQKKRSQKHTQTGLASASRGYGSPLFEISRSRHMCGHESCARKARSPPHFSRTLHIHANHRDTCSGGV